MTRKKIELVLVALTVFALLASFVFVLPFGGMLIVLGFGCLATFYLISGLNTFNSRPDRSEAATTSDIGFKTENIAGIVFAVVVIALLFNIKSWPMAGQYLNIGLGGIALLLVLIGLKYSKTKVYDTYLLRRSVIYACLLIILMILPPFTLIDFKYRGQPAYRDALKRSIQNPMDTGLRMKVIREQEKVNK